MLPSLSADNALITKRILDTNFSYRLINPMAIVRLEGLGKLQKYNDLVRIPTREFQTCSIVPQKSVQIPY
jgi:hypothetical protein